MMMLKVMLFSLNFSDRESSFHVFAVVKYSRNLLFGSVHKDWYICQQEKRKEHGMEVLLDFYNGQPDVLDRCTFLVNPIAKNVNKLQNCQNVLGPVEFPEINGQPLPHPPHLVPHILPPPVVVPPCMPVCPAGPMGGAAARPPSAGTSAVTVTSPPGIPSVSTSPRRKLKIRLTMENIG